MMIAIPYIQQIDFERLDIFLTILNFSLTILKASGVELVDQLLLELLKKLSQV